MGKRTHFRAAVLLVPLLAGCYAGVGHILEEDYNPRFTVIPLTVQAPAPQPQTPPQPQTQAGNTSQGGAAEGNFCSVNLQITFVESDVQKIKQNGYTVTISLYDKATGVVVRDADGRTTEQTVDTSQLPKVRYAVDKVPPGMYQLRITITDGKDRTWIHADDIYI